MRGTLPASTGGAWRVLNAGPDALPPLAAELEARGIRSPEAAAPEAIPLARELAAAGVPLTDEPGGAGIQVAVVATRLPLDHERLDRLRALCRERPTIAVGLQNDAFLDEVPEAAVTLSAADQTPLTRRVVARALAAMHAGLARAG